MKWFLLFLLVWSVPLYGQTNTAADDRRELHDLLVERQKRFDAYAASLDKHSGFFGNKTKGDLKQSHAMLSEIVETDNKIIRTLNRVVDFRNYEKATMNYDIQDRNQRLEGLLHSLDTLSRRTDVLKMRNQELERQMNIRTLFIYILAIAAGVLFFIPGRRFRKTGR